MTDINIDANRVITNLRAQLADAHFALAVATARAEQAEAANASLEVDGAIRAQHVTPEADA